MRGIQCHIDLDWASADHIIRVEWLFKIGGKTLRLVYGLGKFTVDWLVSYWPYPAAPRPNVLITPEPNFAYLGFGTNLQIDRYSWPLAGQDVLTYDSVSTIVANTPVLPYQFPKVVTGAVDDSNILLTLYIDGLHCVAECNGMVLTTQLFPDVAQKESFYTWSNGLGIHAPTLDGAHMQELHPNGNITSCWLSIYNQAQGDLNDGNNHDYEWYGDLFATINSIEWDMFTPTDDSAYLTKINTAPTFATRTSHPRILKPGYWYRSDVPGHDFDVQEVVADTEGFVTSPQVGGYYAWYQNYDFQYQNTGKGVSTFPSGAEVILRTTMIGGSNHCRFYSRQNQDKAWVARNTFTPLGISTAIPKFLAKDNTTDIATWNDYEWGKKYNDIYSVDTVGLNFIQNKAGIRMLAKTASDPNVLGFRNHWERTVTNVFYKLENYTTYEEGFPEAFKKLRYWGNDDLYGERYGEDDYQYPFPFSDLYFDDRLDLGACGVYGNPDMGTSATPAVYFIDMNGDSEVVKANLTSSYSEPWIKQRTDGTWLISWFENGNAYTYTSANKLVSTFSEFHSQTGLGDESNIYNIQRLYLANGGTFIIGVCTDKGYPWSNHLYGWYRTADDEDWQGPYTNHKVTGYIPPIYVTELSTGYIELGWWDYDASDWVQYRTNDLKQDLTAWDLFIP